MRGLVRMAGRAIVACAVIFSCASAASAADRRMVSTPNADYAGFDYRTVKDTNLAACQATCVRETQCKAATFNQRAGWCFLKTDFGPLTTAQGSIAGRIVESTALETLEKQRVAELEFLRGAFLDEARRFAGSLRERQAGIIDSYSALSTRALQAARASRPDAAVIALTQMLALASEDAEVWLQLAQASLDRRPTASNEITEARQVATSSALNAYLRADNPAQRQRALTILSSALQARAQWNPAIRSLAAALAIREDARLRTAYNDLVRTRGFRIASHEVDADAANPQICLVFSDALAEGLKAADFVGVDGVQNLSIEAKENQICITGVKHGGRYHIRVRAGIANADGDRLPQAAELDVFVRDRAPWVGFAGNAYVLPAGQGATIPINSINTDKALARIYRIGDRNLNNAIADDVFLSTLERYQANTIENGSGEKVWEGEIVIKPTQNEMVTTGIPINDAVKQFKPGAYVIIASIPGVKSEGDDGEPTQWFVVSDLGLTTLSGTDGIHAVVRSLSTAKAMAGVRLRLVAANNEVLATANTDADGHVVFAPGLARGKGGNAPKLLVADSSSDYGFLDLRKSAFDLSDRGVAGRPAPEAIDLYATPERGIYRPGETVFLTALARDARANAITGVPLTLIVQRPDGVEYMRKTLADQGEGGYSAEVPMRPDAMRGSWTLAIHADPKGESLTEVSVLVEDFEPERLAFDIKTDARKFSREDETSVNVEAKYLYGAVAPGLPVEGDIAAIPTKTLDGYAGYVFGRADDKAESTRQAIDATAVTDDAGKATLDIAMPELPETTRPLRGQLILRMADTNGRAVERRLSLPIELDGNRIGIRSLFDGDGVPEGTAARFEIVMVDPNLQRVATRGLKWTLSRLETRYQWYRENSVWKYEPVTTARKVGDGTIDTVRDRGVPLSANVDYGRYRLEVTSEGKDATSSSLEFSAGWYVADTTSETPEILSVALDKPSYRVGDTAKLRLDPKFAGTALVMVIDDRVITMKTVDVPAAGTSVDLPVTDEWGPGAYVTAALYRPMDVEARRMPARALGLSWAKVDPGQRNLSVSIDAAPESRPRGKLTVPVALTNLAPGTDAYVTVAAVDLGILNITNFKIPAPDSYYFAQRELGIEYRDLYGQLIDRMAGVPGEVRSGGDGAPTRLGSPPPTQKLVAFYSGVKKVGADGKVEVSFDIPDFNGTVRLMAVAWSRNGVGHASKDVFVRDPVVVTASLPRFLHTGDRSRLLVEMNNVSGAAGNYRLTIEGGEGLTFRNEDKSRTVALATGQRVALNLPVTGALVGDWPLKVTLTTPAGETQPKDLLLGVRPSEEPVTRRSLISLAPGARLTVDAAALAEFVPRTSDVLVSVGGAGKLDIPGLLAALDRYPYGCSEQLTSRALPLLYLNEVARASGIAEDGAIRKRVQDAISGVLANQSAAGGFGLWGPGSDDDDDLWLSSYVTDFITRAAQNGYEVPALARTIALDNLSNRVAYAQDFKEGGQSIAYALYVLARNSRASMGDLRYYVESKLSAFSTPLAKAHLGAALALYGDRQRSQMAFRAATGQLAASAAENRREFRADYGSYLRDGAAVLTLASETRETTVDTRALTNSIATWRDQSRYLSTQEQAWMLLAASALIREAQAAQLTINGQPLAGSYYRKFDGTRLAGAPVVIQNTGAAAIDAALTTAGSPLAAEPAVSAGFKLERAYYKADGKKIDVKTVGQNERFVVVLTVTADAALQGRLMVVDPLPAGFEIENPNISASGDTSRYEWLNAERSIEHSEARSDRFVAAIRRDVKDPVQFSIAYTVRAVSPGQFSHPGATVEDMYRPERRGRTATAAMEVVGLTR